jgi:hypothetical protein
VIDLNDIYTLHGALQYGREGRMEEWIHGFLTGVGHNPFLSYIISLEKRYFTQPVLFRLNAFKRNCGPEAGMKYRVKQPGFEFMVQSMMASIRYGWDVPPLIIEYKDGTFDMSDGNHRYEALVRLGFKYFFTIFWTTKPEDYQSLLDLITSEHAREFGQVKEEQPSDSQET